MRIGYENLMPESFPPVVRIAHLSDVHLPPPLPVAAGDLMNKRALSLLSWHFNRRHHHLAALGDAVVADIAAHHPALIAMTGDLTNFGLIPEMEAGAAWLASLPAPAVIVPGNHDRMTGLPWAKGLALWSPWMAPDEAHFPYVRRIGPVALIGVNSAVPSPPFMAYGRVGARQTARLAALLRRLRGSCRVVLIHHPPRTGLVPWRKSLLDSRAVTAALKAAGAELVLHGHSHDASASTVRGTGIPLIGSASASLDSSKPGRRAGWNALDIRREGEAWRIDLTRRVLRPEGDGLETLTQRSWLRPVS